MMPSHHKTNENPERSRASGTNVVSERSGDARREHPSGAERVEQNELRE
jgi:hypothetical protein